VCSRTDEQPNTFIQNRRKIAFLEKHFFLAFLADTARGTVDGETQ
jgi:hypothetical protein